MLKLTGNLGNISSIGDLTSMCEVINNVAKAAICASRKKSSLFWGKMGKKETLVEFI